MKHTIRLALILGLLVSSGPPASGQTAATGRLMREKLGHSQRILEAILSSNLALLERETAALVKVTELPGWTVLRSPEYLRQSEAFLRLLRELRTAARESDLDTAAQRYVELTLTCFACHRHMKDKRLADR